MTISDAAARAGLTPSAIRYYGRERRFTESDIEALVWIRRARAAGVALVDVESLYGESRAVLATLARSIPDGFIGHD